MYKNLQRQKDTYKSFQNSIAYNRENLKLTCLSAKDQLSPGVENSFKILVWEDFPMYMISRHHKYYQITELITKHTASIHPINK